MSLLSNILINILKIVMSINISRPRLNQYLPISIGQRWGKKILTLAPQTKFSENIAQETDQRASQRSQFDENRWQMEYMISLPSCQILLKN